MAIRYQIPPGALTAQELLHQGHEWTPHVQLIVPTHDEVEATFVQSLLEKHATEIQAYAITPVFDGDTFSVELQFCDEAAGERCRREYQRGFGKGGIVPKTKQANSTKAKKRLYSHRMYRLPDGEYFFYYAKWDRYGNLVGKVYDEIEGKLRNKVVHRSVLEEAELIPKGDEPWLPR